VLLDAALLSSGFDDIPAMAREPWFVPETTNLKDQLEAFLKTRLPLTPNTEWQVEVDERRWIHFVRRYASPRLNA